MTARTAVETRFVRRERDRRKHSPAYKIFYYMFDVSVPYAYHFTENYTRYLGVPVSDDPEYNKRLPAQMVGGRYTVAQMAELFDEGAQILLSNPEDALTIYEMIFQHLEVWSSKIRSKDPLDLAQVPDRDLLALSRLGDELYRHAKRFVKMPVRRAGGLISKLQGMRGGQINGGRHRVVVPVDEKGVPERPQLKDHAEFTKDIMYGGNGRTPWS